MEDERMRQAKADLDYFQQMLDTIPSRIYYGKQNLEKKRELEEQDGSLDVEAFKKAKFDPSQIKTVSQLQHASIETTETAGKKSKKNKKKKKNKEAHVPKAKVEENVKKVETYKDDTLELSPLAKYSDLQQKLHAKIEALRGNRKNTEEWKERKKLRRKESLLKLKMRRKANKQNNQEKGTSDMPPNGLKVPKVSNNKPIYNREGNMVFSKFDFIDKGDPNSDKGKKVGKDYKKMLANLEREKEKVKQLKETNPEKAKKVEEKTLWKSVLDKASGVKVRDDPELLKKAVKRKEKLKKKGEKAWTDRKDKVQDRMDRKQEKRTKNLKKRKESKIKGKIDRSKKKGHIIPGF
ncbi:unnamed protein product [Owenia fusiformis]|uniref:Uncharacterized protein n=1 Tax=Owenia fusiformis TaxID=6347 RepID=A0A8J1UWD9_OWEFU|nr:unnamed protein product [Owenia fusiformis]